MIQDKKTDDEAALREAVAQTARELGRRGLNRGSSGNVSARFGEGMLITPSGIPHDQLTAEQIVPMMPDGTWSGTLKPSSEWRMHLDIYRHRPEAGAVIHTHSDHATALACLGEPIPAFHYMVAIAGGEMIDCAPYATFGTEELSRNMLKGLANRKATLLAHHGMICFGADLREALLIAEEVEGLARQYILARSAGEPRALPPDEMARVLEKFRGYGQRAQASRT
jgi:L-fuculose-phosphate aldolase